jgi:hypothetical protein
LCVSSKLGRRRCYARAASWGGVGAVHEHEQQESMKNFFDLEIWGR